MPCIRHMFYLKALLSLSGATFLFSLTACSEAEEPEAGLNAPVAEVFLQLVTGAAEKPNQALRAIESSWEPDYIPLAIETLPMIRSYQARSGLLQLLNDHTGQDFTDRNTGYAWLWKQPYAPHADYAALKSLLYRLIDPKFAPYFSRDRTAHIRLDEVVWGGVRQDGIPPLRKPAMISADKAAYLNDQDVVFGISVNGDVRAYPKRILAWHEMFVDTVGGEPVNGVYCTLCGSMILYRTTHQGTVYNLGTSGFLYRSNKLMYDRKTSSLWNTLQGKPVIGPLADEDIQLERLSVVTTTWGEWKTRHPDTSVLSLNTGHRRNYSEGAAYRDYFATDRLMFTVPTLDSRLKNKAEVLGLIFPDLTDESLAIAADFLAQHPVYHGTLGSQSFVVLTDASGANRVYENGGVTFSSSDGHTSVKDESGSAWTQTEDALTHADGRTLKRLPAHRAFWFGWKAAFEDTRLVK